MFVCLLVCLFENTVCVCNTVKFGDVQNFTAAHKRLTQNHTDSGCRGLSWQQTLLGLGVISLDSINLPSDFKAFELLKRTLKMRKRCVSITGLEVITWPEQSVVALRFGIAIVNSK